MMYRLYMCMCAHVPKFYIGPICMHAILPIHARIPPALKSRGPK